MEMDDEDDLISKLSGTWKEIKKRTKELEEREKRCGELEVKKNVNIEKAGKLVKLNVGGKKFAISKTSLLHIPDTYFHALFSSNLSPDSNDAFFIDRNPKNFGRILDFLRDSADSDTAMFNYAGMSEYERSLLARDLDYLQITIPNPPLRWDTSQQSVNVMILDSFAVKFQGQGAWNCGVAVNRPADRFMVRIVNRGDNGAVSVGFSESAKLLPNGTNWDNAHYIYIADGKVYPKGGGSAAYTNPIANGSTIEAIHDKFNKQISFSVDGVNKGVAFNNVGDVLFPFVDIHPIAVVQLL